MLVEALQGLDVLQRNERLPTRGQGLDWRAIALGAGVDADALVQGRDVLRPGLEALRRELRKAPMVPPRTTTLATAPVVATRPRVTHHPIVGEFRPKRRNAGDQRLRLLAQGGLNGLIHDRDEQHLQRPLQARHETALPDTAGNDPDCRAATNSSTTSRIAAIAASEFRIVAAITTPCSVNAQGK